MHFTIQVNLAAAIQCQPCSGVFASPWCGLANAAVAGQADSGSQESAEGILGGQGGKEASGSNRGGPG